MVTVFIHTALKLATKPTLKLVVRTASNQYEEIAVSTDSQTRKQSLRENKVGTTTELKREKSLRENLTRKAFNVLRGEMFSN